MLLVEHVFTGEFYANRFIAKPADVAYGPARLTPRPRLAGCYFGLVVGSGGDATSYVAQPADVRGTVYLQFPWDLNATAAPGGIPARLAQGFVGNGFGIRMIPRAGMEAVVVFVDGDPDRPLVISCVANQVNALPLAAAQ